MDRGTIDELTAVRRFGARIARPEAEMHALSAHVRKSLTPIESTVALLGELRGYGYTLYGLSNRSELLFAHRQSRHDFFELFDGIVVSAAVILVKPDPAIFEHLRDHFAIDSLNRCSSTTCGATSRVRDGPDWRRFSSEAPSGCARNWRRCSECPVWTGQWACPFSPFGVLNRKGS